MSENKGRVIVGRVWFPTDEYRDHFMQAVLVDSTEMIGGNECQVEYGVPQVEDNHLGDIVFVRGRVFGKLLAHEASHAALCYAGVLMQQPAIVRMGDEEQGDYFNECVPTLTENVYDQLEKLIGVDKS